MPDFTDYQAELDSLERRRKLLAAMMKQGAESPVVGTSNGIGQALAKTATMLGSAWGDKQANERGQEVSRARQEDLMQGLNSYMNTSAGKPEVAGDPNDMLNTYRPEVKADPRAAVLQAMASQHPELKAIGQAGYKEMMPKTQVIDKKLVESPGWGAKPRVVGSFAEPVLTHNNQFVDTNGPTPVRTFDARDKEGPLQNVAPPGAQAPIYAQQEKETGKMNFAPASSTTNIDLGGKPNSKFNDKLGEGRAAELLKSFEVAKGLPQKLTQLDEASNALNAGIKSGTAAEIQLGFAKAAKALGLGDVDPAIANTEQFKATMASSVLEVLKVLRPASDKDVEYAEKAAGGKISLDDAAMSRLINSARAAGLNAIIGHERLVDKNMEAPGAKEAGIETLRVPYKFTTDGSLDYVGDQGSGMFRLKNYGAEPAAVNPKDWGIRRIGR